MNMLMTSLLIRNKYVLCISVMLILILGCKSEDDSLPDFSLQMDELPLGLIPGQISRLPYKFDWQENYGFVQVYMNDSLVQTTDLSITEDNSLAVWHKVPLNYAGQMVSYQIVVKPTSYSNYILASKSFEIQVFDENNYDFVSVDNTTWNSTYRAKVFFGYDNLIIRNLLNSKSLSSNSNFQITVSDETFQDNDSIFKEYTISVVDSTRTMLLKAPTSLFDTKDVRSFIQQAHKSYKLGKQQTQLKWREGVAYDIMLVHSNGNMDVFDMNYIEFNNQDKMSYRGIRVKQ